MGRSRGHRSAGSLPQTTALGSLERLVLGNLAVDSEAGASYEEGSSTKGAWSARKGSSNERRKDGFGGFRGSG